MKTILKTIAFKIGVDCLGFPSFHHHNLIFKNYITPYHKKYHKSIKFN